MPSPVMRIAPKPRRFTGRSPPMTNVLLAAARSDSDLMFMARPLYFDLNKPFSFL
jgi:hypothetical protein